MNHYSFTLLLISEKAGKMALGEKSFKVCKYLLFSFNALFLLAGLGLLGAGIWIVIDTENFKNKFASFLNLDSLAYVAVAYVVIGVGAVVAIISFVGCCGALCENKCLLKLFFVFLLIWVIIQIAIAVLVLVFNGQLETLFERPVKDIIRETYIPETSIAKAYDEVQRDNNCCGFKNGNDYHNSNYSETHQRLNPWPESCCTDLNDTEPCLNMDPPSKTNADRGCIEPIAAILSSYVWIIGGACLGLAGLMIVSMVITCCVISSSGRERSYRV